MRKRLAPIRITALKKNIVFLNCSLPSRTLIRQETAQRPWLNKQLITSIHFCKFALRMIGLILTVQPLVLLYIFESCQTANNSEKEANSEEDRFLKRRKTRKQLHNVRRREAKAAL